MTGVTTAQIGISSLFFLFTFILSSSFDLSLCFSVGVFLIQKKSGYIPVFIFSLLLFALGYIFDYYDFSFRYISDLTLDGYIFFLSGIIIYFRSRKETIPYLDSLFHTKYKFFSTEVLIKIGGTLVLSLLLFPLFGGYIAGIVSYIFFSYLQRSSDGRISFLISLIFLLVTAILYAVHQTEFSNETVNYTYLFLIMGLVQEAINSLGLSKVFSKMLRIEKIKDENIGDMLLHSEKVANLGHRRLISQPFVIVPFALIIILFAAYLIYSKTAGNKLFSPSVKLGINVTPTLEITPTLFATPTVEMMDEAKMASLAASLKVSVQNGTTITGMAASTAAMLKTGGFGEVEISNAQKKDYKNWEIYLKNENNQVVDYIKKLLNLEILKINQPTPGAKYDILIIAGEEK